ncbi:endonuclease/exonuclease/phosphatase family protein [Actinosynnema sp. NPDC059797]
MPPDQVVKDNATGNVEDSPAFDATARAWISTSRWRTCPRVDVPLTMSPTLSSRSGRRVTVVAEDGADATILSSRGALPVREHDANPERLTLTTRLLREAIPADLDVGDRLSPACGVLDYRYGTYEIAATYRVAPLPAPHLDRETARPAQADELAIATFNVENLSAVSPQEKVTELARTITTNLSSPGLIVVEEIQDNDGPTDNGVTAADRTWRTLIDGITAVGGPRYDYRQIDPINNTDGPLSLSPGRIEPTDPAFTETRKSLAGEFVSRGTRLVVVANHLSAKRGDDPILGRFQPPRTPSTERRARQTAVLADFARQLLHRDRNARLVLAGDFNDTEYSAPLRTLRELGLTDLPATLPEAERYTYLYQGNAQVLDHILLSPALTAGRHDYDIVHVNAEFHDQVSDHDLQTVRLHVP